MKAYVITEEVSEVKSSDVLADFDTIHQAEEFMLQLKPTDYLARTKNAVILKKWNWNQWWVWDKNEPTQGWLRLEPPFIQQARAQYQLVELNKAQVFVRLAADKDKWADDEPTNDVRAAIKRADIEELRANAKYIIAKAERAFLNKVFDYQGNIDWPIQE